MYDSCIREMVGELEKAGLIKGKEEAVEILKNYWEDQIADVWCVSDVMESGRENHPTMTEDDARKILANLHDNMDAAHGINWTTIENETLWYFKDKDTNETNAFERLSEEEGLK